MNEEVWNDCTDPSPMLTQLSWVGMVSDRKLRLFAVAACRRIWFWLEDPQNELILEAQESFADGQSPQNEIPRARQRRTCDWPGLGVRVDTSGWSFAFSVAQATKRDVGEEEMNVQAALLRCIFGPLPFRPVALDPAWLTPTVANLAHAIYHDRAFHNLPVLADALEEAGCHDAHILTHCRQPGEHVRGCWVVDLVLGKT
jgi:hypothetical protein